MYSFAKPTLTGFVVPPLEQNYFVYNHCYKRRVNLNIHLYYMTDVVDIEMIFVTEELVPEIECFCSTIYLNNYNYTLLYC